MKFDFSFGKKQKNIFQWTGISLSLFLCVLFLHQCTGIPEKHIWNLIDEIQRELRRNGVQVPDELNDYIIKTPELLQERIRRDVDSAINSYEREEKKNYIPRMKNQQILEEVQKPKYSSTQREIVKDAVYYECSSDGSKAQELLGGPMGIHSAWYPSVECNYHK